MVVSVPLPVGLFPDLSGHWLPCADGDPRAIALFERHYSADLEGRRRRAATLFVGPGEKMVLLTADCSALFVWRREQYRRDGEIGVNCAVFRNEGTSLSSDLIREADELAWQRWPGERLFTHVKASAVRSSNPGFCFLQAGWTRLKRRTKVHGHRILEIWP